jgi:hypothetical protein
LLIAGLPSKSVATALRKCVPSTDVVVFHGKAYGAGVIGEPTFVPSNRNCTFAIPTLLDAAAVTVVVPETDVPAAGDVTEIDMDGGGVVLPNRGTIPHIGISANPLFRTVDQLVAPVSRLHDDDAPVALWSTA